MRLFLPKIHDDALIRAEVLDECFDRVAQVLNGRIDQGNFASGQFLPSSFRDWYSVFAMSGTTRKPDLVGSWANNRALDRCSLGVLPVAASAFAFGVTFHQLGSPYTQPLRDGYYSAVFKHGNNQALRTVDVPAMKDPLSGVFSSPGWAIPVAQGEHIYVERDPSNQEWTFVEANFVALFKMLHST